MLRTRLTISVLCALLLPVLAAACAPAPTAVPTEVPPTPTALQLAPSLPPATVAPATSAPATNAPASPASTGAGPELTGAVLYELSCAACHGQDRLGKTLTMDDKPIAVPALTWDDLNSTYQTDPSRGSVPEQLALAITKGQDETGGDMDSMMPRWSSLSQAQVDSLVQLLQTAAPTSDTAPALTGDAASLQGEVLYQSACAACHGADGAGKTLERTGNSFTTPSLSWAELTTTYSADPSRGSVADQVAISITKGQDETGGDLGTLMPRWSFLSKEQVDSLVQYLQTTFK